MKFVGVHAAWVAVIMSLLVICGLTGTQALAGSGAGQPYGQLRQDQGQLLAISGGGGSGSTTLSDMSTEHLIAVGVGIVLAVAAMETTIDGGAGLSVLAAVGGALVGDWWFREHLWPFD